MFSRYTERAQQLIVRAQEEVRRLGHDYVGTEHLLLALLGQADGIGLQALQSLGVGADRLRAEVEKTVGRGGGVTRGEIGFSPRAKRVMVELATGEARRLGHNYVGSEHILLGLMLEEEGVAAQVLRNAGVGPDALREAVLRLMGGGQGAPGAVPAGPPEHGGQFLPLSRAARNVVIPLASEEAAFLGAGAIEPEHLLLGILRDAAATVAAGILREKGITLEWLRERLRQG